MLIFGILLFCMLIAAPFFRIKDLISVIIGMFIVCLVVSFLWYIAFPVFIIWLCFIAAIGIYKSKKPKE